MGHSFELLPDSLSGFELNLGYNLLGDVGMKALSSSFSLLPEFLNELSLNLESNIILSN